MTEDVHMVVDGFTLDVKYYKEYLGYGHSVKKDNYEYFRLNAECNEETIDSALKSAIKGFESKDDIAKTKFKMRIGG